MPWQSELDEALSAQPMDVKRIWTAYEQAWAANASPAMTAEVFVALFSDSSLSTAAIRLVRSSSAVRATLERALSDLDSDHLYLRPLQRAAGATILFTDGLEYWKRLRASASLSTSCTLIRCYLEFALEEEGREDVRRALVAAWPISDLREEESETIVKTLQGEGALERDLLRQLGPAVEAAARRLARRGEIPQEWNLETLPVIESTTVSTEVRRRLTALLAPLRLTAEVRDAGLRPEEMPQWRRGEQQAAAILQYFRRFGLPPQELGELASHLLVQSPAAGTAAEPVLEVPLIRLLHLRLILEAPSLRSALAHPEDHLVPEVFLHVLGREGVTYDPELRLAVDLDRRWRARWAESTGEALATVFLEDTVGLKLQTLSRIPEKKEPTPDFMAETASAEYIVFEAKGSTDWETHLGQRRKALKQLRKVGNQSPRQSAAGADWAWAGKGRAFACSLFASTQGAGTASRFHVEDPPFAFRGLFAEGWSDVARRRHYAAVLQACEEHALARALLEQRVVDEAGESFEKARFSPQLGERGPFFLGRFDALDDLALRLGHPDPESFRGLRVFRGVEETLFRSLAKGRIPWEHEMDRQTEARPRATGPLPGDAGASRGVYSLLADGALIAFEAER